MISTQGYSREILCRSLKFSLGVIFFSSALQSLVDLLSSISHLFHFNSGNLSSLPGFSLPVPWLETLSKKQTGTIKTFLVLAVTVLCCLMYNVLQTIVIYFVLFLVLLRRRRKSGLLRLHHWKSTVFF